MSLPYESWMSGGSNELIFASAIAIIIQFSDVFTYMHIQNRDIAWGKPITPTSFISFCHRSKRFSIWVNRNWTSVILDSIDSNLLSIWACEFSRSFFKSLMRDFIRFDSSAFVGEDSDLCISNKHIMNVCGLKFRNEWL